MKNYQHRRSKLLYTLRNAKKNGKETVLLKILYRSDIDFLESQGYAVYPTFKKRWYKVIL